MARTSRGASPTSLAALALGFALVALAAPGCKPKSAGEAEAKGDVAWLAEQGTPDAIAALGRLADKDARALSSLQARQQDVNAYIAAWGSITRSSPWGTPFLRAALADPQRADIAASALPRRDPRLVPFVADLEGAVVRLAAGHRGSVVAGVLASVGPAAHAAVERRLVDAKTRGAMCDGISLPEASGDAKSTLLAVAPESRDHASCVANVLAMAGTEDSVLGWLATGAEPGLLSATAKSTLACPRLAMVWNKALTERPPETHGALTVPLKDSVRRCAQALDPVLAELLAKAPTARGCIVSAIDPYGGELADLKNTCASMSKGYMNAESPRVRERAGDAVAHGCRFAR